MKVNAKQLKLIIKKISIGKSGNEMGISSALLKFNDDGVQVISSNADNTIITKLNINTDVFTDYEVLDDIALVDLSRFMTILSRHTSDVQITLNKNMLVLKDKSNTSKINLSKPEFIQSTKDKFPINSKKVIEWTEEFEMVVEPFKGLIGSLGLVSKEDINIKTESGKLILSCGESGQTDEIITNVDNSDIKGGIKNKYNINFVNTIAQLENTDNLKIKLLQDKPIYLILETDNYKVEYLVAQVREID